MLDWIARVLHSFMDAVPLTVRRLSAVDLAQLARCAWQRQQASFDPARASREFATVALWNALGCRLGS